MVAISIFLSRNSPGHTSLSKAAVPSPPARPEALGTHGDPGLVMFYAPVGGIVRW